MNGLHGNYQPDAGIGAPAADLAAIVSGIGDCLHAFARAMRPAERLRLLHLLDVLIANIGTDDPRATVPKALLSVIDPPLPPARLRVIPGGKSTAPKRRAVGVA